jgi:hypothetical protein
MISSRNDSFANVFCIRPGVRIQDGRSGVVAKRWQTVYMFGKSYGSAEFGMTFPGSRAVFVGLPVSCAGSSHTGAPAPIAGMIVIGLFGVLIEHLLFDVVERGTIRKWGVSAARE